MSDVPLLENGHPLGPPQGPRHNPAVRSEWGAVSYERCTPLVVQGPRKVNKATWKRELNLPWRKAGLLE
jgi:hypothetical protein